LLEQCDGKVKEEEGWCGGRRAWGVELLTKSGGERRGRVSDLSEKVRKRELKVCLLVRKSPMARGHGNFKFGHVAWDLKVCLFVCV
jgi:hypothetical protein